MPEPSAYVEARIREALAHDELAHELHVDVRVAEGCVFLSGEVPTGERRDAIVAIVRRHAEGRDVVCHVTVDSPDPPARAEEIR